MHQDTEQCISPYLPCYPAWCALFFYFLAAGSSGPSVPDESTLAPNSSTTRGLSSEDILGKRRHEGATMMGHGQGGRHSSASSGATHRPSGAIRRPNKKEPEGGNFHPAPSGVPAKCLNGRYPARSGAIRRHPAPDKGDSLMYVCV